MGALTPPELVTLDRLLRTGIQPAVERAIAEDNPLTPQERRQALCVLGWDAGYFARQINRHRQTVCSWLEHSHIVVPIEVDAWLRRVSEFLRADPPPVLTKGRPGRKAS